MANEILPKEPDFPRTKPESASTLPKPMNAQDATPPHQAQPPAKRKRSSRRELKEEESESEVSERGMYLEVLGKLAVAEADKNRLLEIFDKSRQREGARRNDFEQSQRHYLWFMMADKERDMGHIKSLNEAFIGMLDKYAEAKQLDAKSKVGEVIEVITAVLQVPIFVALQELAMERLQKKKALKDPAKEKRRRQLERELAALEKGEDPDE